MLVCLALTAVAEWDLLRDPMIVGMDTATAFYPWYAYLGEQLRSGHIPVWNQATIHARTRVSGTWSEWLELAIEDGPTSSDETFVTLIDTRGAS